jgi:hypothetical protein
MFRFQFKRADLEDLFNQKNNQPQKP